MVDKFRKGGLPSIGPKSASQSLPQSDESKTRPLPQSDESKSRPPSQSDESKSRPPSQSGESRQSQKPASGISRRFKDYGKRKKYRRMGLLGRSTKGSMSSDRIPPAVADDAPPAVADDAPPAVADDTLDAVFLADAAAPSSTGTADAAAPPSTGTLIRAHIIYYIVLPIALLAAVLVAALSGGSGSRKRKSSEIASDGNGDGDGDDGPGKEDDGRDENGMPQRGFRGDGPPPPPSGNGDDDGDDDDDYGGGGGGGGSPDPTDGSWEYVPYVTQRRAGALINQKNGICRNLTEMVSDPIDLMKKDKNGEKKLPRKRKDLPDPSSKTGSSAITDLSQIIPRGCSYDQALLALHELGWNKRSVNVFGVPIKDILLSPSFSNVVAVTGKYEHVWKEGMGLAFGILPSFVEGVDYVVYDHASIRKLLHNRYNWTDLPFDQRLRDYVSSKTAVEVLWEDENESVWYNARITKVVGDKCLVMFDGDDMPEHEMTLTKDNVSLPFLSQAEYEKCWMPSHESLSESVAEFVKEGRAGADFVKWYLDIDDNYQFPPPDTKEWKDVIEHLRHLIPRYPFLYRNDERSPLTKLMCSLPTGKHAIMKQYRDNAGFGVLGGSDCNNLRELDVIVYPNYVTMGSSSGRLRK